MAGRPQTLCGAGTRSHVGLVTLSSLSHPPQLFTPWAVTMQSCLPLPAAQQKQSAPVSPFLVSRCLLEAELCLPDAVLTMDSGKTCS